MTKIVRTIFGATSVNGLMLMYKEYANDLKVQTINIITSGIDHNAHEFASKIYFRDSQLCAVNLKQKSCYWLNSDT